MIFFKERAKINISSASLWQKKKFWFLNSEVWIDTLLLASFWLLSDLVTVNLIRNSRGCSGQMWACQPEVESKGPLSVELWAWGICVFSWPPCSSVGGGETAESNFLSPCEIMKLHSSCVCIIRAQRTRRVIAVAGLLLVSSRRFSRWMPIYLLWPG